MNTESDTYRKSVLENGIRIVTDRIPGARSISMGFLVDAGPRDESPDQCGLAHLAEHLMFQGTSSRTAMQIARLMDGAGGYVGGFTTRDYTCYSAVVPAEFGTYALDLYGDILLNAVFPEESVAREKDAVICEIEAAQDHPDQFAQDLLRAAAWPDHPLGRPVAGEVETVRRLTREDVIYFIHANYLPNRIVVAAAGHVEHDDFVAQVRDAFWRMMGEHPPRRTPTPEFRSGVTVRDLPVSQVYFCLGVRALPYAHADRHGLYVLDKLLGGGISSRLFRRLREEHGLVYHIGSDYVPYIEDGLLLIEGATIPENLKPVLDLTIREVRDLLSWREPVDEEELRRAKTQIRGQHLIAGESTDTRMGRLATQEFYFGRRVAPEEVLDGIEAVDEAALERLVRARFAAPFAECRLSVVGPEVSKLLDVSDVEQRLFSGR